MCGLCVVYVYVCELCYGMVAFICTWTSLNTPVMCMFACDGDVHALCACLHVMCACDVCMWCACAVHVLCACLHVMCMWCVHVLCACDVHVLCACAMCMWCVHVCMWCACACVHVCMWCACAVHVLFMSCAGVPFHGCVCLYVAHTSCVYMCVHTCVKHQIGKCLHRYSYRVILKKSEVKTITQHYTSTCWCHAARVDQNKPCLQAYAASTQCLQYTNIEGGDLVKCRRQKVDTAVI